MISQLFRQTVPWLLLFLVTGCATQVQTTIQAPPGWTAHRDRVEALQAWQLRGKFALISPEEKVSANLAWQQESRQYRLTVTNFIGTTLAQLEGQPGAVSLNLPDEGTFYDKNPDDLLTRMTGWQLPVQYLYYWVRGLPGLPQARNLSYTPEGYLAGMEVPLDDGLPPWQILVTGYKPVAGTALPHSLELQRGDIRIKFAVIQWVIPSTA